MRLATQWCGQSRVIATCNQSSSNNHHTATSSSAAARNLIQGKRFVCTECGKCCTGAGEVFVNKQESTHIAQHLNMSVERFYQRYTLPSRKHPGWHMLKTKGPDQVCIPYARGATSVKAVTGCTLLHTMHIPPTLTVRIHVHTHAQACIFLKDSKLCSIYQVRPVQCSTYPWWPELLTDAAWEDEATRCEGINHETAHAVDVEHAAAQLHTMLLHSSPGMGVANVDVEQHQPFDFLR